jgi:hypothetical protein
VKVLLKFLENTIIGMVGSDNTDSEFDGSPNTRNGLTSKKIPGWRMLKQVAIITTMRYKGS